MTFIDISVKFSYSQFPRELTYEFKRDQAERFGDNYFVQNHSFHPSQTFLVLIMLFCISVTVRDLLVLLKYLSDHPAGSS
jgi:hypothetical protein